MLQDDLIRRFQDLNSKMDSLKLEKAKAEANKEALDRQISEHTARLSELGVSVENAETESNRLKKEVATELAVLEEEAANLIRAVQFLREN